jgi:hypothetical protein
MNHRHLMARFRHHYAAEYYDWQPGRPLAWWRHIRPEMWSCKKKKCPSNDAANYHAAHVYLGEERYGLVAKLQCSHKDVGGPWMWGIHKNDSGKHWAGPGEWSQWRPPARYYGYADSLEEAKLAAQADWEKHKGGVMRKRDEALSNPDYENLINPRQSLDDDDFGDIFGEGR